jgi:hypothetical protein
VNDNQFGYITKLGNDETLPIVKNQNTQKRGIQGTKWKDPHPRRQKNHKRNIKFMNPFLVMKNISNKKRANLLKGCIA